MAPLKPPRYCSIFSILSLVSLIILGFYFRDDIKSQPQSLAPLNIRQWTPVTENNVTAGLLSSRADDPYTCGPDRPCSNGACCGPSGNCGYAPAYCGTGCLSNCDAKAACGQYAEIPGTTCPLNACCSEHGFCGTTQDFCQAGCQSNCILEPQPPAGSPKNASMDILIGYYETWSHRSKCNQKSPSDLPLSELTHLNYAFASIDPSSYALTTMDDKTSEDLWQLTVDAKKFNVNLKVYVAVGGWTFSDNGTVTQPLLGEIASTESNRQKFADGVVKFLNKYGFDGLDIDWEYPGAPDRGGKPEDTANFVLLMKTLRLTFDASPRSLGLTFTIPSSFWYLRWFDLPGLLQYADWTNLMSYDLHGTWDRNNPIGAIAQAHTNLTEINLAVQLLWRVGVKPEQVVLGYGFYGRSFELADPSCSTPGCAFSGGAKAGPCSNEPGILMYYEIQAILNQIPDLEPVFDREAAVKYLTFDDNQWISYDDDETFKLKKAWANDIGFGGSMIWAVDTDDDKFTAMSGLVGRQVSHVDTEAVVALAQTSVNVASSLQGENGQGCRVLKDYQCKATRDLRCESGETLVGWDRDGCDEDEGKPICCPGDTAPNKCVWRGSGNDGGIWGDCNGQCHSGEARLFDSSWGGGPEKDRESDPYKCARGHKVFCCEAGDWKTVIDGCRWTQCIDLGNGCSSTETQMATKKGACPMSAELKYCCPKDTPLHDCTWRGSAPDCVDTNCKMKDDDGNELNEVQVDAHAGGSSWNLCSWDRTKSLCCQVSKELPPPLTCDLTTCDFEPEACSEDDDGQDDYVAKRRDLAALDQEDGFSILEKRGPPRPFKWWTVSQQQIDQWSLAYITLRALWRRAQSETLSGPDRWFGQRSEQCDNPQVESRPIETGQDNSVPPRLQVEHPLPILVNSRFPAVANHGRHWAPRVAGWFTSGGVRHGQATPEGPVTRNRAIRDEFWQNVWNNAEGLPAGLPLVTPDSTDLRRPADRVYEAMGSNSNIEPFTFLEAAVNRQKGQIERYARPQAEDVRDTHIANAVNGNTTAVQAFMAPLRETRGVFQYLRDDQVVSQLDATVSAVYQQLQIIEANSVEAAGLSAHWSEFYPHYFSQVSQFARDWATAHIAEIRTQYNAHPLAANHAEVLKELKEIEDSLADWKYKFED